MNCTSSPRSDRASSSTSDRTPFQCRFLLPFLSPSSPPSCSPPLRAAAVAQAPQPPEVAAKSYLLLDLTSDQTLAERDADAPTDPASLTKLMTAYLVFHALRDKKLTLEQKLPVSKRAWDERKGGGSLMFIDTTMTPTVDELLHGMIVQCGNDAAVALAEGVGGTLDDFVAMMNRQAQAWGLKNTAFKNVTGLTEAGPPQHRARPGGDRGAHHPRLPRVLPVLLDEGVHATTTSPSRTATCCCAATRPSTA